MNNLKNVSVYELNQNELQISGGAAAQGSPNIQFDWDADPTTYVGNETPSVTNPNDPFDKKDLGKIQLF